MRKSSSNVFPRSEAFLESCEVTVEVNFDAVEILSELVRCACRDDGDDWRVAAQHPREHHLVSAGAGVCHDLIEYFEATLVVWRSVLGREWTVVSGVASLKQWRVADELEPRVGSCEVAVFVVDSDLDHKFGTRIGAQECMAELSAGIGGESRGRR